VKPLDEKPDTVDFKLM